RVERHGAGGLTGRQSGAVHLRRRRSGRGQDQVGEDLIHEIHHKDTKSTKKGIVPLSALCVLCVFVVIFTSACPGRQKVVVYDLARRAAGAAGWSGREVLLFGTPAAEPHQVEGFYREAGGPEGDSFQWSKDESELSFTWPKTETRAAVVDLAPYVGAK